MSRQMSTDPHNELNPHMENYIGIDVGTGSARACVINSKGDILGIASENIGLWQPEQGYYVRFPTVPLQPPFADPCYRNNRQTIYGGASAILSSESSTNTTSIPTPSEALHSMPLAP